MVEGGLRHDRQEIVATAVICPDGTYPRPAVDHLSSVAISLKVFQYLARRPIVAVDRGRRALAIFPARTKTGFAAFG